MRRALLLVTLLLCGCGSKSAPKNEFIPVADIAPELKKVAEQTLSNVKFESARKIKVNGEDVFEIRGKMPNGKIREVEVSTSGKVIAIE